MHYLLFLAHTLIGFYFVFAGIWNIYHWVPTMEAMIQKNIPHPWLVLSIGIAWQTVAGILIFLGVFVKLAALTLIPFTIISVLIFHPFWKFRGETRALHMSIFLCNMTMTLGALLLLMNTVTPLMQFTEILS